MENIEILLVFIIPTIIILMIVALVALVALIVKTRKIKKHRNVIEHYMDIEINAWWRLSDIENIINDMEEYAEKYKDEMHMFDRFQLAFKVSRVRGIYKGIQLERNKNKS